MRERLVIEPHPISVVQHLDPSQRPHQLGRVIEVEWESPDAVVERIRALERVGQRADVAPVIEQPLRDVLARIPERPGHAMRLR